jgi:hypothetical protein
MYGSVTWIFSSFSVITETTPKTTKAVVPNDDNDMDANTKESTLRPTSDERVQKRK